MSFTFGFTGDDISDDESMTNVATASTSNSKPVEALLPPKLHSLLDILSTLKDVRITFDNFTTPGGNIVYRRELFDIKHQAMMEEDSERASDVHKILVGSENASDDVDLRTNVYEGGFKLWECSYDLVDEIDKLWKQGSLILHSKFLEIGCGTSLPSCYLLTLLLQQDLATSRSLVLSDFNYEVLRLVTVPNLLIHWASTLEPDFLHQLTGSDIHLNNDEVFLSSDLLKEFENHLARKNLLLSFISGLWGSEFCKIAFTFSPELILTSETIYSLDSVPILIDVLLQLATPPNYLALVAAKSYYFGVGGSIKEFIDKTSEAKADNLHIDTVGGNMGQLKRDIVRLYFEALK